MGLMRTINQALFKLICSTSLFYLQLFSILIFLLLNNHSNHVNYFLVMQGLIIGLVAIILIVNVSSGLLAQVVGIFFFVSFCCFPILEMFTDTIYWGGAELSTWDRFLANLIVTIFLVLFIIGYRFRFRIPAFIVLGFPKSIKVSQLVILLIILILIFSFVLYLYAWNFITLFFRGGEYNTELDVELKSSFLLVEFFLRPLLFNLGLFLFYFARDNKGMAIFALCLGLFAVSPTGVPRFLATAMYMPFLLNWAFVQANDRKATLHFPKLVLPNMLLVGLFSIFPFLDIFRTFSLGVDGTFNVFGLNAMLAGHFDSYQMFVRALSNGELTYGYGFFGALLFFVPRSLWSTKPIGSAQEVAHLTNLSFDNLSMTLVAEFYLNFWYIGIIFGALLLGVAVRSIDIQFIRKRKYEISVQWIFYFQSVGLLLFILRGSFLSAFAYSVAVALTWLTIRLFYRLTYFDFTKKY